METASHIAESAGGNAFTSVRRATILKNPEVIRVDGFLASEGADVDGCVVVLFFACIHTFEFWFDAAKVRISKYYR